MGGDRKLCGTVPEQGLYRSIHEHAEIFRALCAWGRDHIIVAGGFAQPKDPRRGDFQNNLFPPDRDIRRRNRPGMEYDLRERDWHSQLSTGNTGHGAALLVVHEHAFPLVDLRCDWDDAAPLAVLRRLWTDYAPQMQAYLIRALDPSSAPSYGVAGNR